MGASRGRVSFTVLVVFGGAVVAHLLLPAEEDADGFPRHNLWYLLIVPALALMVFLGMMAQAFWRAWRRRNQNRP